MVLSTGFDGFVKVFNENGQLHKDVLAGDCVHTGRRPVGFHVVPHPSCGFLTEGYEGSRDFFAYVSSYPWAHVLSVNNNPTTKFTRVFPKAFLVRAPTHQDLAARMSMYNCSTGFETRHFRRIFRGTMETVRTDSLMAGAIQSPGLFTSLDGWECPATHHRNFGCWWGDVFFFPSGSGEITGSCPLLSSSSETVDEDEDERSERKRRKRRISDDVPPFVRTFILPKMHRGNLVTSVSASAPTGTALLASSGAFPDNTVVLWKLVAKDQAREEMEHLGVDFSLFDVSRVFPLGMC